jgi:ATP-dependent Clp protease ATP-binding subunit ClpC
LQKYVEDPLSEALIQGTLPRPAELEVYLGENGLYCRQVGELEPQPVPAGGGEELLSGPVGTPLYLF